MIQKCPTCHTNGYTNRFFTFEIQPSDIADERRIIKLYCTTPDCEYVRIEILKGVGD